MDDAGARRPEARAVLRGGRLQEVVDLLVLRERLTEVPLAVDARLDQMVAVNRRRHRDLLAQGLAELQHRGLAEDVLEDDAIGTQEQIALARLHLLMLRVVEVPEKNLVGEGEWAAEPTAHDGEVLLHRGVDVGGHLGGRFDLHGLPASSGVGQKTIA